MHHQSLKHTHGFYYREHIVHRALPRSDFSFSLQIRFSFFRFGFILFFAFLVLPFSLAPICRVCVCVCGVYNVSGVGVDVLGESVFFFDCV